MATERREPGSIDMYRRAIVAKHSTVAAREAAKPEVVMDEEKKVSVGEGGACRSAAIYIHTYYVPVRPYGSTPTALSYLWLCEPHRQVTIV